MFGPETQEIRESGSIWGGGLSCGERYLVSSLLRITKYWRWLSGVGVRVTFRETRCHQHNKPSGTQTGTIYLGAVGNYWKIFSPPSAID